MSQRTPRLSACLLTASAVSLVAATASAQFIPGDIYYTGTDGAIAKVVGPGDYDEEIWAATGQYSVGQLAWSHDRATMYFTHYFTDEVVALDAEGNVTPFATGISGPTGLLMTKDGHLLVAEHLTGEITDITGGGDFGGVAPLTDGLGQPRNMVQLPDGTVLVVDQDAVQVFDALYPAGGTVGAPYITGLTGELRTMTVAEDGTLWLTMRVFTNPGYTGFVYDVTGGGDFSAAQPHASGQPFYAVTFDANGTMLASELFGKVLWDVTAGGDFSAATPWATGLPLGEAGLGYVPDFICGTGTTEGDEECDDANDSNEDACTNACTDAECGDGHVYAGVEECDDDNTDDGDGCSSDCKLESTGPGGMGGGGSSSAGGDGGTGGAGGGAGGNGGGLIDEDGGCAMTGGAGDRSGAWAVLAMAGLSLMRRRRRSA